MSKKKKKFKKKISQNLSERIAQVEAEKPVATVVASPQSSALSHPKRDNDQKTPASGDKYAYVKRDIKRDFIIIGILVLLLAATTVVNTKTGYLKKASRWIYSTLNLKV